VLSYDIGSATICQSWFLGSCAGILGNPGRFFLGLDFTEPCFFNHLRIRPLRQPGVDLVLEGNYDAERREVPESC
jgi:hypothetical protein